MKRKPSLVPGWDYLLVDNHKNRVVAEFIGISRHGYMVLASKNHTYTTRGPITEFFRNGKIRQLPRVSQTNAGGKPMKLKLETRTSQRYEDRKNNAIIFILAGLMLMSGLRAAFLMDQLKELRAELTQARASVSTYHALVRRAGSRK